MLEKDYIKNIFKKCYVINLDRRKDRYNDFLRRLPFNSSLCHRFSAIDGKNITNIKINENPFVIGCHLSHKTILKMVIDDININDDDLILIFEDDVFFIESIFKEEIIKLNETIKLFKENNINNFIIYIGGRFKPKFKPALKDRWKLFFNNIYEKIGGKDDIPSCDYDRTTNVIILNKFTCKEIINKTIDVKLSIPIDTLYNNIQKYIPEIKIYDLFPHICYSPCNYETDIQNYKKK